MDKYKRLAVNAALAFTYSVLTAFALSSDEELGFKFLIAIGIAGGRVAAGVFAAGIDKPIPMDTPPPGGPDPVEE